MAAPARSNTSPAVSPRPAMQRLLTTNRMTLLNTNMNMQQQQEQDEQPPPTLSSPRMQRTSTMSPPPPSLNLSSPPPPSIMQRLPTNRITMLMLQQQQQQQQHLEQLQQQQQLEQQYDDQQPRPTLSSSRLSATQQQRPSTISPPPGLSPPRVSSAMLLQGTPTMSPPLIARPQPPFAHELSGSKSLDQSNNESMRLANEQHTKIIQAPNSPPQLNRYLSTNPYRAPMLLTASSSQVARPSSVPAAPSSPKQVHFARSSTLPPTVPSATPFQRVPTDYHLTVTDIVLRLLASIASAVAFSVMITNSVWVGDSIVSYSDIAGFRFVAGISAVALVVSILQLGGVIARKLKAHTTGLDAGPERLWLFLTLVVDQLVAYLLLSAGSVGIGALMYISYICKDPTLPAEYCSRSTLSVVLTLVSCTIVVMNTSLSTFRFYQKTFGS